MAKIYINDIYQSKYKTIEEAEQAIISGDINIIRDFKDQKYTIRMVIETEVNIVPYESIINERTLTIFLDVISHYLKYIVNHKNVSEKDIIIRNFEKISDNYSYVNDNLKIGYDTTFETVNIIFTIPKGDELETDKYICLSINMENQSSSIYFERYLPYDKFHTRPTDGTLKYLFFRHIHCFPDSIQNIIKKYYK